MLIEVKVKITKQVDGKQKTTSELFLHEAEFFSEVEQDVMALLNNDATIDNFEITSMRISPIKELLNHQQNDESTYIATLKASYTNSDGVEKTMRYKTLLWASSLAQANAHTQEFVREGYDMKVEGITEKEYILI